MPNLRSADLAGFPIPWPDSRSMIAALLSTYDDLIENNTRRIAILEETARRLYEEWFVNFRFPGHDTRATQLSDGLPEGWRMRTLGEVAEIVMGQSPRSEFYNTQGKGLPFHQGVSHFRDRFPEHVTYCTAPNRVALPGDVLFSVRAPVGRINLADTKLIVGRGVSAIRARDAHQVFLFLQLKHQFKEEDTIGGGTIFKAVTRKDMEAIPFLVPREAAVAAFEDLIGPSFPLLWNLVRQNEALAATRDLLLPRLISGQIAVPDLDIEVGEGVA
jgi:type I restriction enzyme S subunit